MIADLVRRKNEVESYCRSRVAQHLPRLFVYAGLAAVLVGCALETSKIGSLSTEDLCSYYWSTITDSYKSPAIRSELDARGQAGCTDESYLRAKNAAAMGVMQQGLKLMQQSRPSAAPVTPMQPTPKGCSLAGERVSGLYKTCFYSCTGGMVTATVGAVNICSLTN